MGAIIWNRFNFSGVKKRVQIGRPELDVQHTKFFGVPGTSAIDGKVSSTPLSCEMWLNRGDFVSAQAVSRFLAQAQIYVGFAADLTDINPTYNRVFKDCEFHGFEQRGDILPVIGVGMLPGTYWVHLELFWLQLNSGWQ